MADSGWVRANIKRVEIPQLIGVHGAPATGLVYINRQIEEQFVAFFGLLERLDLLDRVLTWSGSWVTRFVRGRTDRLSNHSFGTAFDINAAWNGFRKQPALVGRRGSVREIVPIAFKLGFFWGGWYNDGMHFEAYKAMSTEEVAEAIQQLIREHGVEDGS